MIKAKAKKALWKITEWLRKKMCRFCGGELVLRINKGKDENGFDREEVILCPCGEL